MELQEEYISLLLSQAAEVGNMLFWQYFCQSKQWKIGGQTDYFLGKLYLSATNSQNNNFSTYDQLILPEDREQFQKIISGDFSEENGAYMYCLHISGDTKFHKCRYERVISGQEEVILGTITDETDKIKLSEKETVFEYIAKYSNIGIFSYTPGTGQEEISEKWYENFGLSQGFSLKETMQEFAKYIHPDDKERIRQVGLQLRNRERIFMDEEFRLNVNNTTKWVRYIAIVRKLRHSSNDIQIVGLNQDITHAKKQEERNTKILEVLPDFIFIFNRDFLICDLLKSNEIQLLHSLDELIGANGRKIFSQDVCELYIKSIARCLQSDKLVEIEYYLDAQDKRHYFQARLVPFEDNKVLALIHDIGDRVKRTQELIDAKQKAEEADKMKSAFLANMSHEIRTPLNAIVGFSEIIATSDDSQEKESYIEIIRNNSNILLQLINDVLDLSRIESGKTSIELQEIEVCALMEEIRQVHSLKMKAGIELRVEHPERNIWIRSDRNKIAQVVSNFMSNALKNTEHGSITLRLAVEYSTIRISVTDTGCGIPPDRLRFIFERFAKLNDFVQGTGLGLAICQTIAEKLNGNIEVESTYGEGSTFSLVLPYMPGIHTST